MTPEPRVPIETLVSWVAALFVEAGIGQREAHEVADTLVDADARGVPSHGVMLVPMYLDRLAQGSISRVTTPTTVSDFGAVATLDAGHGLGQLSAAAAMNRAIDKASQFGVGAVAVRSAFHFGAAGRYVRQATSRGFIGIVASNTRPMMPAPGGAVPLVGNNPLAIGVPGGPHDDVVLDMALSNVALGKIRLAETEGNSIPIGWATDARGIPTDDPREAIAGMLLPMGGHKGFGLALMVDILTGVLSGGASGDDVQGLYKDVSVPNDCAHFFLALNVAAFGDPKAFAARVEGIRQAVERSPSVDGDAQIRLPGHATDQNLAIARRDGVRVAPEVLASLSARASSLGPEYSFDRWMERQTS